MIKVNYRALGMLSTNCYVVENPDSQKAADGMIFGQIRIMRVVSGSRQRHRLSVYHCL